MSKTLKISFIIVLTLLLAATIWAFAAGKFTNKKKTDNSEVSDLNSSIKATAWSIFKDGDLQFSYPTNLGGFDKKDYSKDSIVLASKKGNDWAPDYTVNVFPNGYQLHTSPFGTVSDIFTQPIDPNIKPEEFEEKYSVMYNFIKSKKLDDSSILIFKYFDIECSVSSSIEIVSPIIGSAKYSNIVVEIGYDYSTFAEDELGDCGDYQNAFEAFANKIINGQGDSDILAKINAAQNIAESFVPENISSAMAKLRFDLSSGLSAIENPITYRKTLPKGALLILPSEIDPDKVCGQNESCVPSLDANGLTISAEPMGEKSLEEIIRKDSGELDFAQTEINTTDSKAIEVTYQCDGIGCNIPNWYISYNKYVYRFKTGTIYDEAFRRVVESVRFQE